MMYTQEQYDALLAVCRSYKQEVERLEEVIAHQNNLCWDCKKSVEEFAERVKEYINNKVIADFDDSESVKYYTIDLDEFESKIDELLKEYKK